MTEIVLVLTTVSSVQLGEQIAKTLVEERLAACVNIGAAMRSIYRWNGRVEEGEEFQLVIKTTTDRVADIEARIRTLHTYELPELLVVPVRGGGQEYMDWLVGEI